MSAVILGIVAMTWSISADREHRDRMPEVCCALEIKGGEKSNGADGLI